MVELLDHEMLEYIVENSPLLLVIGLMFFYTYTRCDCGSDRTDD